MARSLSVALAQYAPITGPNPIGQPHSPAREIHSGTRDLDLIVLPEVPPCGDNIVKTIGADRKQESVRACAIAIINQVFAFSVNAAGPVGMGGSLLADPEGTVIAELPTAEPGLIRLDIDLDDVTRVRPRAPRASTACARGWRPMTRSSSCPSTRAWIDPTRWRPADPEYATGES